MKRRRAALVRRGRVRAAFEQHLRDGEISRANRLMKRRDGIAIPRIDDGASLDEQRGDPRSPRAVRATQIRDAMKRRLAESIGRAGVRAAVEEIRDDGGIERLRGVQKQRSAFLVDDELRRCDGAPIAEEASLYQGVPSAGWPTWPGPICASVMNPSTLPAKARCRRRSSSRRASARR